MSVFVCVCFVFLVSGQCYFLGAFTINLLFFRFKNHLFDLTFMEKVTRWLTNTQVKVKSEVSSTNKKSEHSQTCIKHKNLC